MTESPTIALADLAADPDEARYLVENTSAGLLLVDDDGVPVARLLPVDDTGDDTDDDEPADTELSIEEEPFEDDLACFDDAFEIGAE